VQSAGSSERDHSNAADMSTSTTCSDSAATEVMSVAQALHGSSDLTAAMPVGDFSAVERTLPRGEQAAEEDDDDFDYGAAPGEEDDEDELDELDQDEYSKYEPTEVVARMSSRVNLNRVVYDHHTHQGPLSNKINSAIKESARKNDQQR
jgi:hypothetical protein